MFLQELKKFSKENWWVYLLLVIALTIAVLSGKGDIMEMVILFFANLLGNLFIMVMQANYTSLKNKTGAIYQLCSSIVFTSVAIYSFIKFNQYQYIVWQISFSLAAISSISFFAFNKNIKFLNAITMGILNIVLFVLFIYVGATKWNGIDINLGLGSILMALGFSFVTTGLVSKNNNFKYCYHNMCIYLKTGDRFRYWLNVIGILGILLGSGVGVFMSYNSGNINGVDLGYMILTSTVFVFYMKLLPKYIKK